jgi:hypothetical protein
MKRVKATNKSSHVEIVANLASNAIFEFFDRYDIQTCEHELWDLLIDSLNDPQNIPVRPSGRVLFCKSVMNLLNALKQDLELTR